MERQLTSSQTSNNYNVSGQPYYVMNQTDKQQQQSAFQLKHGLSKELVNMPGNVNFFPSTN